MALRRQSAIHLHANLIVGIAAAFVGLGVMLFSEAPFGLVAILVDPFVIGFAVGALVELLPGVKRVLTPSPVRRRTVIRAAHATFVERGVHNTIDRSGLLVYVSWLEQQVALVADFTLETSLTRAALERAEARLTASMSAGGVALARVLVDLAPELAVAMPRRAGDINELSDVVDSDLHRRPFAPR